jgi:futalosine hydrolase
LQRRGTGRDNIASVPVDLLICAATELESSLLAPHLPVLVTGVGAVNAACALTRYMEREGAKAVIVCGIGGAYPGSGLNLTDTAWAASECYGDLGAASANGFLDMEALGFPLIPGEHAVFNILPLQIRPAQAPGHRFVTVNTCTGSEAAARELSARTGGAVESMEGAAIAHVARLYGIPAGEIRGISNPVGNRDRAAWRVRDAANAAQEALLEAWRSGALNL